MNDPYRLSDVHDDFRAMVRRFSEDKIAPRAEEIDATDEYPTDLHGEIVKADLLSVMFPEDAGGAGADSITQAILVEEMARVSASAVMIPLLNKLGMIPVLLRGTSDQKLAWIPKIIAGEEQAAYGLDRKSTRLNSSHIPLSRMPSSA